MRQRYRFLKLSPSSRWHRRRICPTFFCYKPVVLVALVPGAGLEPARTLPGPRDFKSHSVLTQQHQRKLKVRFSRGLVAGVCSCLLVTFYGLGTVTGTASVSVHG